MSRKRLSKPTTKSTPKSKPTIPTKKLPTVLSAFARIEVGDPFLFVANPASLQQVFCRKLTTSTYESECVEQGGVIRECESTEHHVTDLEGGHISYQVNGEWQGAGSPLPANDGVEFYEDDDEADDQSDDDELAVHTANLKPDTTIKKIEQVIGDYVYFDDPEMHLLPLTLYVAMTHCFYECFSTVPYLMVSAEDVGFGKSLLLDLLASLSYPSQFLTEMSIATMFEHIDTHHGSLFLDEFEEKDKEGLKIINGGYKRGGCVTRKRGKEWVKFSTFCPKGFGLVGHLYRPLMSRCICVFLEQGATKEEWTPSDQSLSETETINPITIEARDELHALVTSKLPEIRTTVQEFASNHPLLKFLKFRERELWKPLFVLCKVLAPDRLDELTDCATFLIQRKVSRSFHTGKKLEQAIEDDAMKETTLNLISDIYFKVMHDKTDIESEKLMLLIMKLPRGKAIEDKKHQRLNISNGGYQLLSRMFRPYRIVPKVLSGGKKRGYTRQMFIDALQRAGLPTTRENPVTMQPAPTPPAATPVDEEPPSVVVQPDSTPVLPENPVTPKQDEGYGVTGSPLPPASVQAWRTQVDKWIANSRICYIPLGEDKKRVSSIKYDPATRRYDLTTADGTGTLSLGENGMTEVIFTIGGMTTTYELEWVEE